MALSPRKRLSPSSSMQCERAAGLFELSNRLFVLVNSKLVCTFVLKVISDGFGQHVANVLIFDYCK
jgi:hypothetical protein